MPTVFSRVQSTAKAGNPYPHRQRGLILGLNGELTWGPTVDELAGPVRARLAFQPLCEVTAAAQPRPARSRPPVPAWWACSCPPHDAPRQSRPAPRCPRALARAAQLTSEPATPPGVAQPGGGWISGPAYEHRWQADVLGRGRGRPLFRGQGLEPTRPRPRVTGTMPPRGEAMHAGAALSQKGPWGEPAGGPRGRIAAPQAPLAAPSPRGQGPPPRLSATGGPAFVTPQARAAAGTTPTGSLRQDRNGAGLGK
jgi:hypothetical protein